MPRTATTANAILGMLAIRRRWPVYELTKQLRRNMRFFWPRAESRIYAEAKRLVEDGLATAETSHTGERRRTSYSITPAGRHALSEWLDTPPRGTVLECEPLLRIFLADGATREQLQTALGQIRADARAILEVGEVVGLEYLEDRAPFQDQVHVRGFVFDFLSNYALMLLDWADRTESILASWSDQSPDERDAAALELIRTNLARFPEESARS